MDSNDNKGVRTYKIAMRIMLSWGLLFVMLAPFLWGLLPLGYTYIKQDPNIKANPTFIVFMRMFCGFAVTTVLGLVTYLVYLRKKVSIKELFRQNFRTSLVFLILLSVCYFGARLVEMKCILGFSYEQEACQKESVATNRYCMFTNKVCAVQLQHPYLMPEGDIKALINDLDGMTNCVSKAKIDEIKKKLTPNDSIAKTSTNGLQEFGYFMGLLLTLILVVKNHKLYGFLAKCANKIKWENVSKKLKKQQGTPISFLGTLSLLITLFLIIASGVLNLAAREPLYAWSGIWEMLGLAFLVAVFTSFASDFKGASSLCDGIGEDESGAPKIDENSAAIFSSLVINAIMSLFAAGLAYLVWRFLPGEEYEACKIGFWDLCGCFFKSDRLSGLLFWFSFVVVFLCSFLSPVFMLWGTQMHNNHLKKIKVDKYGVAGKDWMQILSAAEPLFVVIIGYFAIGADSFISSWPIWLSVGTVLIIILLRIMEVWAEKNSVLRNYVFTQVRGSSRGIPDRKDGEKIEDFKERIEARIKLKYELPNDDIVAWSKKRALDLVWLKLYDKRNELEGKLKAEKIDEPRDPQNSSLTHPAIDAAAKVACTQCRKIGATIGAKGAYVHCSFNKGCAKYFVIEGCDKYFTQDDPVTHDVLSAIFDWLQMKQLEKENYIRIDSFSYLFKEHCDDKFPWKNGENGEKGLKNIACDGHKDATPFVLIVEEILEKDDLTDKLKSLDEVNDEVIENLDALFKEINTGRGKIERMANEVILTELERMEDKNEK